MSLETIIKKIRATEGVVDVFVLEGDVLDKVLDEEGNVDTSIGMPLENRALEECIKKNTKVCVFCGYSFEQPTEHVMIMEDGNGNIVGHDIPIGSKDDPVSDPDAVWLSEDFVMFPGLMTADEVKVVMLPQKISTVNETDGAKDPMILYPAPTTDEILRKHFGIDVEDPDIASALIAFDI
jgi:hypothetical protein